MHDVLETPFERQLRLDLAAYAETATDPRPTASIAAVAMGSGRTTRTFGLPASRWAAIGLAAVVGLTVIALVAGLLAVGGRPLRDDLSKPLTAGSKVVVGDTIDVQEDGQTHQAPALTFLAPDGSSSVLSGGPDAGGDCAAISPSGQEIALTEYDATGTGPAGTPSVVVRTAQGGSRQVLARSSGGDYQDLVWAPTGQALAVIEGESLVLIHRDGSPSRKLLGFVSGFDWAPDGRSLAAIGGEVDGASALELIDAASGSVRYLAQIPDSGSAIGRWAPLRWSPDGSRIAVVLDGDVQLVDSGTGQLTDLTPGFGKAHLDEPPLSPVWSADGSRIGFAQTSTDPDSAIWSVWTVGSDGTGLVSHSLVPPAQGSRGRGALLSLFDWSPDLASVTAVRYEPDVSEYAYAIVSQPLDGTPGSLIAEVTQIAAPRFGPITQCRVSWSDLRP